MLYIFIISSLCVSIISFQLPFINNSIDFSIVIIDIYTLNHCYIFGLLYVYHSFMCIHKHKINELFLFKSKHFSFRSHIVNFMHFILDFLH